MSCIGFHELPSYRITTPVSLSLLFHRSNPCTCLDEMIDTFDVRNIPLGGTEWRVRGRVFFLVLCLAFTLSEWTAWISSLLSRILSSAHRKIVESGSRVREGVTSENTMPPCMFHKGANMLSPPCPIFFVASSLTRTYVPAKALSFIRSERRSRPKV
jgi:hypothetical protein